MVTRVRNVNPLQFALVAATLYAVLGLFFGLIYGAVYSVLLSALSSLIAHGGALQFGWFALLFFPIFYGVLGFIGGLITALLYNLIASWTGGIEVTLTTPVAPTGYAVAGPPVV